MADTATNPDPAAAADPADVEQEQEVVEEKEAPDYRRLAIFLSVAAVAAVLVALFVLAFSTNRSVGELGRWAKKADKEAKAVGDWIPGVNTFMRGTNDAARERDKRFAALQNEVAKLKRAQANMAGQVAKLEEARRRVDFQLAEHEETLYGDGENPGLVERVGGLEKAVSWLKAQIKKIWAKNRDLEKAVEDFKRAFQEGAAGDSSPDGDGSEPKVSEEPL